jgi:hypothetical protein
MDAMSEVRAAAPLRVLPAVSEEERRETLRVAKEARRRERIARRLKAGGCANCPGPKEADSPSRLYCVACCRRRDQAARDRRAIRKRLGLCGHCGNERGDAPATLGCRWCLDERNRRDRELRRERKEPAP